MHEYHFLPTTRQTLSESQVKSIISEAGYAPGDYTYETFGRGYKVSGRVVMSLTKLRKAAEKLKLKWVEISSPNVELEDAAISPGALAAEATDYQVSITMSPETVQALLGGNYLLYGFKAVQATQGGGAPLVWFHSQTYSTLTEISWQEQYQAYTSDSEIIPNGQIVASFSTDIDLGQTLQVDKGGFGSVVDEGPETAISILNTTNLPFTCGISQMQDGAPKPLCAFPLYGEGLDAIAPIEKVLLTFSTLPLHTATVIFQAYSQSILIDLTAGNHRSVQFDINKGWSWGGFSWAQTVPPDSNLLPLLIEPATSTSKKKLLAA